MGTLIALWVLGVVIGVNSLSSLEYFAKQRYHAAACAGVMTLAASVLSVVLFLM